MTSLGLQDAAGAVRRRLASGHFSSAPMSQILQSFLIGVLREEVFAKYQTSLRIPGIGKQIKVFLKLSRDIAPCFFSTVASIKRCGDSCREHRRSSASVTLFQLPAKGTERLNMAFERYERYKVRQRESLLLWCHNVPGRSWSRGTCWENWTCGTSRASWKDRC